MGRIRTTLVKRTARELIEKYGSQFTENFSSNQEIVNKLVLGPSKVLKNKISGYITKIMKRGNSPEE